MEHLLYTGCMIHIPRARFHRFIRTYRLSLILIVITLILWGVGAASFWLRAEKAIRANESAYAATTEKTKEYIALAEAKAKAEERQKAEEEEKAKQAKEAEEKEKAAQETAPPAVSPTQPSQVTGCNPATTHDNPSAVDVLVNKKHCLKPLSFVPPDLVTSNGATLSAKAIEPFKAMYAAAAAAGQPFSVSSSYRSYATQVSTYNYWVSVNGQQGADTVSARPGFSEHQTGFVIDVGANGCILDCFGGTTQYQWFQANAANYGFIQRYYAGYEHITGYAGEEWHYRYVGAAVAQDMKSRGIKTLEQYWGFEGGNYR